MDPQQTRMPFLCALGRHRPKPDARWNDGYYFTRCARCGRDLVRTAFDRWHEPRGHRVVWLAQPPANAVSVRLVPQSARAAPAGAELPIQDVLRELQTGEERPTAGSTRPRSKIPDFMDEGKTMPAQAHFAGHPRVETAWAASTASLGPSPVSSERLRYRLSAGLAGFRKRFGERAPAQEEQDGVAFEPRPAADHPNLGNHLLLPVGLVAMALFVLVLWTGSAAREAGTQSGPAIPLRRDVGQSVVVTASVLSCRSAPASEADTVSVLMRGDVVPVLGRDGEWVRLAEADGQCWALARDVSL